MRKLYSSRLTSALLLVLAIFAVVAVAFAGTIPAGAQAQPMFGQPSSTTEPDMSQPTSTTEPDMSQPTSTTLPDTSQPGSTQSEAMSPEAILTNAALASEGITSGTGDFVITVMLESDDTAMSGDMQAFFGQPITLSGTYSFNGEPVVFESMMDLSIAGQNLPLGLKAIDGQTWVQFLGRWYEVPMDAAGDMSGQAAIDSFADSLLTSGIDPSTWMSDLTLAGEEDLEGTNAYHLTGTLNADEMLGDVLMLLQEPYIMQLIGGLDVTNEDIMDAQAAVSTWVNNVSLDMWVATDTFEFRQFQMTVGVVPPAGEGEGISGVTAKATVTLDPAGTSVTVEPPTDVRPFSELEQMLDALTGLFGGDTMVPGMSPDSTGTTGTMMPMDDY